MIDAFEYISGNKLRANGRYDAPRADREKRSIDINKEELQEWLEHNAKQKLRKGDNHEPLFRDDA